MVKKNISSHCLTDKNKQTGKSTTSYAVTKSMEERRAIFMTSKCIFLLNRGVIVLIC